MITETDRQEEHVNLLRSLYREALCLYHEALMAIGQWQKKCPCTCGACQTLASYYKQSMKERDDH